MNNIHNQLVSKTDIKAIINSHIEENIEVTINDINVFIKAFMHKSFVIKDDMADEEDNICMFELDSDSFSSNERLEFLGDAFLNLATAEYLFEKFPGKDEGFLTKLRTKLVRNTQLSFLGEKLGFNKWLLISSHVERISGRDNARLIEDVFESFIAAIYIDQGHDICKKFIFNCFDTYIDLDFLVNNNDNYKDILLRFFQTKLWTHPVYNNIFHVGDVYNRQFTTVVVLKKELYTDKCLDFIVSKQSDMLNQVSNVEGRMALEELMKNHYVICQGVGKTKKISEQECSKNALKILKVPKNF